MMIFEPKCVLWKRLGAEKVQRKIEGLTVSEELEFWQNQTDILRAAQQKARGKLPNIVPERKWPFLPISTSNQNFNPRNTQCMPVVKILIFPLA